MFLVIPDLIWIQPNVSVEKMLCRNFPGFMAFPALFLYYNTFIIVLLQALQLDTQVKSTIQPETWPVPVVHEVRESGF